MLKFRRWQFCACTKSSLLEHHRLFTHHWKSQNKYKHNFHIVRSPFPSHSFISIPFHSFNSLWFVPSLLISWDLCVRCTLCLRYIDVRLAHFSMCMYHRQCARLYATEALAATKTKLNTFLITRNKWQAPTTYTKTQMSLRKLFGRRFKWLMFCLYQNMLALLTSGR